MMEAAQFRSERDPNGTLSTILRVEHLELQSSSRRKLYLFKGIRILQRLTVRFENQQSIAQSGALGRGTAGDVGDLESDVIGRL